MDGLRAIDEALTFLEMEKGDRLGHAIVLGIKPKQYYKDKRYNIYMTKQDYLDDLVWILYKSLEFNVTINANHRSEIKKKAEKLLLEIYFHEHSIINRNSDVCSTQQLLDFYYDSWMLRGDHPNLYINGTYKEIKLREYDSYYTCLKQNNIKDDIKDNYRNNKLIAQFYHLYHFDYKVKETGLKATCFNVEDWYIDLVKKFQKAMQRTVAEKGVIIECNPTSNVLISTFKNYIEHPISSFNNFCLENNNKVNIQATINTDDIGVFDTSLENEYALLFSAISRERHKQHNYNDDAIYEYLDYLRENGIRASFMHRHMLNNGAVDFSPY